MKTPLPETDLVSYTTPECDIVAAKFYTESQLRAAMVAAYNEAIEHCAMLSEGHYGDGHRLAAEIRIYKETP